MNVNNLLTLTNFFVVDAMKRVEEIKQKRQAKFIMNRYGKTRRVTLGKIITSTHLEAFGFYYFLFSHNFRLTEIGKHSIKSSCIFY